MIPAAAAILLTFPLQLHDYLRDRSFPRLDCLSLSEQENWNIGLAYHMDRRFRSYVVFLVIALPFLVGMLALGWVNTSVVPERYSYIQFPIVVAIVLFYVSPIYLYLFAALTTVSAAPIFYIVERVITPSRLATTMDRYIVWTSLVIFLIALMVRVVAAGALKVETGFGDSIIISELLSILNEIEEIREHPWGLDQRKKMVIHLLEVSNLFERTLPKQLQTANKEINLKLVQKFTGVARYIRAITCEVMYPADSIKLLEVSLILKQIVEIMLTANWQKLPALNEAQKPISMSRIQWSKYAKILGEQLVAPLPQTYRLALPMTVLFIVVVLLTREMKVNMGDIISIASILAHG